MGKILASKVFMIEGCRVSLAAGIKSGHAVVVLGVRLPETCPLRDISVDYPMKSQLAAIQFVTQANEDVAVRGKADCERRFSDVIDRIAAAFSDPPRCNELVRKNPFKDKR